MNITLKEIGAWKLNVLSFTDEAKSLSFPVNAIIGNFAATSDSGIFRYNEWKKSVVSAAKNFRGNSEWDSKWHYCITCGFAFHMASQGNRKLDVENFIKPTLDSLAAGLFCPEDQDPRLIQRYDYDDSNFRYMFIQRLDDAHSESDEGVAINLSVRNLKA